MRGGSHCTAYASGGRAEKKHLILVSDKYSEENKAEGGKRLEYDGR